MKILGENSFYECNALEEIENIDGIETIGMLAFYNTAISGKLYFPNIKTLEYGALAFMDNITELEFGPNLETVKDDAFSNDKNLKKIIFNSMDTSFEDYKEVEDEDKALNWEVVAPKGSTAEKWAKDNGLKLTAK